MGWINTTLNNVAYVQGGFAFSSSLFVSEGIPVIRIGDINDDLVNIEDAARISVENIDKYKDVMLEENDILIALTGATVGKTGEVKKNNLPCLLNQRVGRFRLRNKNVIEKGWIKYWLKLNAIRQQIINTAYGGGQPNISPKQIENLSLPLPSPSEQRRIVEILDQADEIRKLRKRADEKAEKIIPALFYEMFGDPAVNSNNYKMVELGSLLIDKPKYGANASSKNYEEGEPRYIRITDVNDSGELNDEKVGVDKTNWNEYALVWGDLLFARSGATVGKTYLYKPEDGECVFAGYMIKYSLDQMKINPWYAFYLTKTNYYLAWVNSKRRAAAQPNINSKEYSSLMIPLPEIDEQNKFVENVLRVREILKTGSKTVLSINSLFDVLLSKAFDGSLTSSWREAHMKELLQEMEEQKKYIEKVN